MNILPTKSWHVRTRKNIAKVDEDERKEAAREAVELKRQRLVVSETRLTEMRGKSALQSGQHVQILTKGDGVTDPHPEHEADDIADREKYEKQVGLLTYLGQTVRDGGNPWWAEKRKKEDPTESERDTIRKKFHDPFTSMKAVKEGENLRQRDMKRAAPVVAPSCSKFTDLKTGAAPSIPSAVSTPTPSSSSSSKLTGKKSIADLRRERVERESKERQRTEFLLNQRKK